MIGTLYSYYYDEWICFMLYYDDIDHAIGMFRYLRYDAHSDDLTHDYFFVNDMVEILE